MVVFMVNAYLTVNSLPSMHVNSIWGSSENGKFKCRGEKFRKFVFQKT